MSESRFDEAESTTARAVAYLNRLLLWKTD